MFLHSNDIKISQSILSHTNHPPKQMSQQAHIEGVMSPSERNSYKINVILTIYTEKSA